MAARRSLGKVGAIEFVRFRSGFIVDGNAGEATFFIVDSRAAGGQNWERWIEKKKGSAFQAGGGKAALGPRLERSSQRGLNRDIEENHQ